MTSADCPDENQLALLGQDAVDPATRAAIEAHLDRCVACDRLLRELGALDDRPQTDAPAISAPPRYQILRRLGAGGMGVVWSAEDRDLHRRVALKVVRAGAGDNDEHRRRLLREARAIAGVRNPNVVTVYDVGEHGDQLFVAMELVDGANARVWRGAAPRSTAEILAVWRAAAAGLTALHGAGVVHRDVKPDNVLVADDGRVLVCDLGLATDRDVSVTTLTRTGQVLGTPAYMAPEQLHGDPADARADQFAWCVALWEALTGARPYPGDSIAKIAVAMSAGPPLPKGEHAAILSVLARGLESEPAKRWPDLLTLVAELDRATSRSSARSARWPWLVATGGVAVALGALWIAGRSDRQIAVVATDAAPLGSAASPAMPPTPADAQVSVAPANDAAPKAPKTTARDPWAQPDASVAPSPVPDIVPIMVVSKKYSEARQRMAKHDGRGCLKILDGIGPLPASVRQTLETEYRIDLDDVRVPCEMMSGACAAGRDRLAAQLRAKGKGADFISRSVSDADRMYCTFDAPGTQAQRMARVDAQLAGSNNGEPCDGLVDAAEAAGLIDERSPMVNYYAAVCLARAGHCTRAIPYIQRSPGLRDNFDDAFPSCKP